MILMDPQDGSIRALVSRPDFDPEFFLRRFSTEEWADIAGKKTIFKSRFQCLLSTWIYFQDCYHERSIRT